MTMANAAMSDALWVGVMVWSQMADAIKPNAKPATPVTRAPTKAAIKKMTRSSGTGMPMWFVRSGWGSGRWRRRQRSAMLLLGGITAPTIESSEERGGSLELSEIVPVHARVAERRREQASRLRCQVQLPGI